MRLFILLGVQGITISCTLAALASCRVTSRKRLKQALWFRTQHCCVRPQFRTGRPADDGICWPVAADDKAKLLRGQALRALAALEALGSAFAAAVAARTSEAAHAAARGGAGDHGHCAQRQPDAHAAAGGGRGPERGAGQAAAPEARPAASAAAGRGGPDVQAQLLLSDAVRAAAGHLGDALRGLLYVVLLASQDWALVYGQS